MGDKEDIVYKAKLAEQAERYDEMVKWMKCVAEFGVALTVEERNLLSVAYKNVIGARRSSWRIISSIEQKEIEKNAPEERKNLIRKYRETIEAGIVDLCKEIIDVVINSILVNTATVEENKVFFQKMLGDYYRYIAEISSGEQRESSASKSLEAYKRATEVAEVLPSTHPIRLGLALNYSVFFYEILNSPSEACCHAKAAFESAIAQLDQLRDDAYKDSTLIMQLLRDNLTLWTSEEEQATDDLEVEDVEDGE